MSAPFEKLIDYWFGELQPAEEAAFEEHLFGCAECTAKLEHLGALGAAVRAVIPHALYEAMKKENLRLREYRMTPGASVNCTIAQTDDFVVSRLEAPLAGVRRVDLVTSGGRFEDVPFDAAAGEVLVIPVPAELKRRGSFTQNMRLIAVEAADERVLGEYTFLHSPS